MTGRQRLRFTLDVSDGSENAMERSLRQRTISDISKCAKIFGSAHGSPCDTDRSRFYIFSYKTIALTTALLRRMAQICLRRGRFQPKSRFTVLLSFCSNCFTLWLVRIDGVVRLACLHGTGSKIAVNPRSFHKLIAY